MTATRADATRALLRSLLPDFYWVRDAPIGVLGALVDAIAAAYRELEDEVEGMYDDLFVETCREMIVPYIGDGVGVQGLAPITGPGVGHRAWVGQVIGLRRRKGTLAAIGRGVVAGTGWAAYVADARVVVARTSALDDVHPTEGRLLDVGDAAAAGAVTEPWSRAARNVSVAGHPVRAGRAAVVEPDRPAGFPSARAVEVAVYRLPAYTVQRRAVAPVADVPGGFTFHPLGVSAPLFAAPGPPPEGELPPGVGELPRPLGRVELARLLLGRDPAPVLIWPDGDAEPVARGNVQSTDLRDWDIPRRSTAGVLVDPELGRLRFRAIDPPRSAAATYSYGFSGELGGGPYVPPAGPPDPPGTYRLTVGARHQPATLYQALADARTVSATTCVIVLGNARLTAPTGDWVVAVAAGRTLRLEAATGAAPALDGRLVVLLGDGATFELRGLMIAGTVWARGSGEVRIEHSTLAPRRGRPSLELDGALRVSLAYAIAGGVSADVHDDFGLDAEAVIVDGDIELGRGTADLRYVTVFGRTVADKILADSCLFTAPAVARDGRDGQVRFSYVPPGSALRGPVMCPGRDGDRGARLLAEPRFTSRRYGDPGYAQLALDCPSAIAGGAEAGGEMGAFNWLSQPDRAARLPLILQELLPVNVAASVTFRT